MSSECISIEKSISGGRTEGQKGPVYLFEISPKTYLRIPIFSVLCTRYNKQSYSHYYCLHLEATQQSTMYRYFLVWADTPPEIWLDIFALAFSAPRYSNGQRTLLDLLWAYATKIYRWTGTFISSFPECFVLLNYGTVLALIEELYFYKVLGVFFALTRGEYIFVLSLPNNKVHVALEP